MSDIFDQILKRSEIKLPVNGAEGRKKNWREGKRKKRIRKSRETVRDSKRRYVLSGGVQQSVRNGQEKGMGADQVGDGRKGFPPKTNLGRGRN